MYSNALQRERKQALGFGLSGFLSGLGCPKPYALGLVVEHEG